MAMDASYWQDVCTRAVSVTHRWAVEQERSTSVLAALLEFQARLRLLEPDAVDAAALGALVGLTDTLPLLHAKHVRGLENLMSALREGVSRLSGLHAELGQMHTSVWERHAKSRTNESEPMRLARPSWELAGAGRGLESQRVALPSALQFIEWTQELDQMFGSELLLKTQLLDAISYDMPTEQLHGVHRIWTLEPNIRSEAVQRWGMLAVSLTIPDE